MKSSSQIKSFRHIPLRALLLSMCVTFCPLANAEQASFWDAYVSNPNETVVIHLEELATIVANMPSSQSAHGAFRGQSEESYIREGITLGALFIIMISGHVFGKRRVGETVILQKVYTAHEEAKIILALGHAEARIAIDSLQGEHKVKVLRAIAGSSLGDEPCELPFVQVERQLDRALQV